MGAYHYVASRIACTPNDAQALVYTCNTTVATDIDFSRRATDIDFDYGAEQRRNYKPGLRQYSHLSRGWARLHEVAIDID